MAVITLKYDRENNGNADDFITKTESYELRAIVNAEEVSIGSTFITKVGQNLEIRFYDSYYNIEKINRVDYSIFEISNMYNQTGSQIITWSMVNDEEGESIYYKFLCPTDITEFGTYIVKMNLYVGTILVGQIDTTFVYEE